VTTKSVAAKLLIRPASTLWLSHPSRIDLIGPLPEDVRQVDDPAQATTAVVFADDARSLREVLVVHRDRLKQPPTFWVAYPKGNKADINRDTLWPIMGEFGMRPITQVAIDQVWSGLRFRALREGEAPFTEGDRRHDRPTTASRRSQAVDLGDPESLSGVRVRSRGDHS